MTELDPHWGSHWVYRLFDRDGRLLYVGMTANPAKRFQMWRSVASRAAGHWFGTVTRVDWMLFDSKPGAAAAERHAVETEGPLHNIHLRPRPVRLRVRRIPAPPGGRVCRVDDCSATDIAARGVCWRHYQHARRNGTLDELYPRVAS